MIECDLGATALAGWMGDGWAARLLGLRVSELQLSELQFHGIWGIECDSCCGGRGSWLRGGCLNCCLNCSFMGFGGFSVIRVAAAMGGGLVRELG